MSSANREKPPQQGTGRSVEHLLIEYACADDLVRDYVENFASGTVFLETDRAMAVGTRTRLQLSFPGLRQPVQMRGVVRWPLDEGEQPGLGIELAAERTAQDALVARIRRGDPSLVARLVRILVVEDNPHVAQLIRNGLSGVGRRHFGAELAFDFRMASNGREAIDFLRKETFHALIVDVYLPVLDGVHVIEHVRARESLRELPVVAVSAGGESARTDAMRAGADHFLAKPIRLKQITRVMQTLFT